MYRNSILYIILVVLILSAVIIPMQYFDKMIEKDVSRFREKIDTICKISENNADKSDIEQACNMLSSDWEKHMKYWCFYINHSMIEKIDLEISSFIENTKENIESAKVGAVRLDKLLNTVLEQDALSLMNIF